jgi:hypothetical protein
LILADVTLDDSRQLHRNQIRHNPSKIQKRGEG